MGLNSRATAQVIINVTNILLFPIPNPPLSEQRRIVQKLQELMKTREELEASIQQSVSLNEKLLHQVLREARKGVAEPGELNRQSFSNPKKEKSETTDL
jgi:restriction endonuclease S subunit